MKGKTEGNNKSKDLIPAEVKINDEYEENNISVTEHSLLAQTKFDEIYMYQEPSRQTMLIKVKNYGRELSCKQMIASAFPILTWLRNYAWKEDMVSDIISGFTVAIMHIPQGMAYSMLGGVPPIVGIYMAFFPVLIYILMGTSRHVSMGTFAVVCMMTGKIVDDFSVHPIRNSLSSNTTECQQWENNSVVDTGYTAIEVATGVCFVVGLWQLFLGIFKLGGLSVLLSETLVSGFSTGAAVHVLTSQAKHIFGVKVKTFSGPLKIIYTYIDLFKNIGATNLISLAISLVTMVILFIFNEWIKPCMRRRTSVPIPIELIAVVLGTLVSMYTKLNSEYNVTTVGEIPTGLPDPAVPPFSLMLNILLPGLVIAIVAFSINMSMASLFARKLNYEIDGNQELLASGVANIFASFFSCIPFAASLSRSLIQKDVGGKTQLTSAVSCTLLLFVLLWIGPFFEPLPNAVLAGIVLVSLKGMFIQFKDVKRIWHSSKMDGLVWILTFTSVVIIDIDIGLAIGVALSVLTVVMLGQKVKAFQLGNIPGTDIYIDINRYQASLEIPGISIFQIAGGIHFANVDYIRKKISTLLEKRLQSCDNKISCLILDMACISFIDPIGSKNLLQMNREIKEKNITLYLANCSGKIKNEGNSIEAASIWWNCDMVDTEEKTVKSSSVLLNDRFQLFNSHHQCQSVIH